MLAGRIGENKYVVEYATDCRAKCKLFSCKRSLFLGELRIGKVPPRVNPLQNKRVHWYHPSCVFQSFRRASKKTKLIDRPEKDLEGWHALQPNDRAFIDLCLRRSREAPGDWALDEDTSSSNAPPEPVDGAAVDLLLSLQAPGAAAAAAAPAAPRPPTYAPPYGAPPPQLAASCKSGVNGVTSASLLAEFIYVFRLLAAWLDWRGRPAALCICLWLPAG